MNLVIFSLVSAIISFIVAIIYSYIVRRKEAGTDEMVSISLYIREGARAFLKREVQDYCYSFSYCNFDNCLWIIL